MKDKKPIDIQAVTIYEQSSRGERPYDIYSRLLADRIIFLKDGSIVDDTHLAAKGSTEFVLERMEAMAQR